MSDLLSRAVIPTNSLVLICDGVEDKLDPIIYRMRASSTVSNPTQRSKIHAHVVRYTRSSNNLECSYSKEKSKEELHLCDVVEAIRKAGFHDAWVHNLTLRIPYRSQSYDFVFRNRPLTEGSEAAQWVSKYLDSLKDGGWVKITQLRHLPLINAYTVPEGATMSPFDISDPSFIAWLGKMTSGLVRLKTVRRVDDVNFVDVNIKDMGK